MPSRKVHTPKDYARFPLEAFPYTLHHWTREILRIVRRIDDDEPVIIAGSSALAVLCEHIGMELFFPVNDVDIFCLKGHDQFKRVAIDLVTKGLCTKLKAIQSDGCVLSGKMSSTKVQFIGYEREHGGTWTSLLNHFDLRVCRVGIVKIDGTWTIVAAPGVLYDIHRRATEIVLPSPKNFKAFCEKYGEQAERIVALHSRGEDRRTRYIEKGFTVYYFDEGPNVGVNQVHPVEVWLAEVVFNRLFTVPYQYLLGGQSEDKGMAKKLLDHLRNLFGEDLLAEVKDDGEDDNDWDKSSVDEQERHEQSKISKKRWYDTTDDEEDGDKEPIIEKKRKKASP